MSRNPTQPNRGATTWPRCRVSSAFSRIIVLIIAAVLACGFRIGDAAELRGRVRDVVERTATVAVDGQEVPNAGDSTTIYFKLPGSEDEVLVANGHVTAVDGATATIAIDKSFGAVQKDQLARIVSNSSKPKVTGTDVLPPTPPSYFNDYAGAVSKEAALKFNEQLAQFERETSHEVVVAIYRRMETGSDIANYTLRIARAWKVGKADKNNGAVLFVFIDDRKMFIQVGEGLLGAMPNAITFDITEQHIKPHFRDGDYEGGLREGIERMLQAMRGEGNAPRPKAESSPPGTAQSWAELDNQARDFFMQGKLPEAIAVLDRAIELDPRNGNAYLRRAICDWSDPAKALADANHALTLGCDIPARAYTVRGRAQCALQNLRAAVEDASKAIEIEPGASEPYAVRADARYRLGEKEEALEDVTKAMALDPKNGEPYFVRGNYFASIGATDAAERDWEKAVALYPALKQAVEGSRQWLAQVRAKAGLPPASGGSGDAPGQNATQGKRDLRSRLLGKWKGGRHTTLFRPDGTFILDPDLTPQPIRESVATWRVNGDQLIQNVAGQTLVSTIVSLDDRELVLKDMNGTWHLKHVR